MDLDLIALLSFAFVTTYTPGPNNLTSASMGILVGYKRTLGYLFGIAAGFFLVMLICGWISSALLNVFPEFEIYLRILGASYILWLAFHTFQASYHFDEDQQKILGFKEGFLLQILNPKAIVYGLTIYSTFLAGSNTNLLRLVISAVILDLIACSAISTWTLFGVTIRTYMNHLRLKQALNIGLALLLVYTAVEISGLIEFLQR